MLASAGLALWVTELDIDSTNMTLKAQGYEDVYRIYFSHPAVEGILMWGFWNKAHWRPDTAIVEGNDFKVYIVCHLFPHLLRPTKTSG